MRKKIAIGIAVVVLTVPVATFADNGQLIALYQQLVQILEQELGILQNEALTIDPSTGPAPLTSTFTIPHPTGTEAIDFGDGHSTGSSGCKTNAQGFCDLSQPVSHTYQFPGSYKVSLYRGTDVVMTKTVTVK